MISKEHERETRKGERSGIKDGVWGKERVGKGGNVGLN